MHAYLIISGRVQGVGFRYSAQYKALEYNITGWVRNKQDGTVEMEVEGTDQQVDSYIKELKRGFNKFIQVEHIEVNRSNSEKGFTKFTVKG